MASNSDWVILLLIFNASLITFMGFYGGDIGTGVETASQENALIPDFSFDLITGFTALPSWLNIIFVIQGVFTIYLLVSTIFGSG